MSSEKNKIPPPPGFPRPLAKILPTESIDDTFMHDDQSKAAGKRTFPDGFGKRCSLRKRVPPNLFVPTHSRPSPQPHGQGRGRGRPRKNRSNDNPASQPLQRGPGRPRKQRSDVTEAPAVSPPPSSPSGLTGDSLLQVTPTTSTPEAVATTPLGSTSNRPLEVPSDEEETKLNVKPLRILMHPPKTNHPPHILDEESQKVLVKVESLLVQKLLTSVNDVDYMVHQANITFRYLKGLGVDYGSFYRDVTEYIKHRCDLKDAERDETMFSLSALQKNYEYAILTVNDIEENSGRTQGDWEKAKEKKETLKRQMEDLKQEVAHIEHEEERLKEDEIKYKEVHEVAKAKMQKLGNQLEAAQAKIREIEQRKNAALRGIESTTRHLKSTFLDDLD